MPIDSQIYDKLSDNWKTSKRYTASADIDVDLSNSKAYFLFFAITATDAAPDYPVRDARPIGPMAGKSFQLKAGERLWLGGAGARALLTTG